MICDAGVIWKRTPGATFSPLKSSAAIRRSSMRAFVHEPRNATSIFVPSTSSTGLRFAGFDGHATCGPMPSTSKVNVFTNVASSSDRIGSNRAPVWARYSFVTGSASIMPTFAPISVVMLHRTKRSFIGKAFTVEPVNSTAAYRAASSPVVPITLRMPSLAPDRPNHVRVTVAPDDQVPRMRVAAFSDQLVDDAVVSHVVEPPDALLPAEIADRLVHLRDLRRRRGDPVIQRDHDLLRVPDLHRADFVEWKQGQCEHLVHVQQVDVPVDDLAGVHGLGVARAREDL